MSIRNLQKFYEICKTLSLTLSEKFEKALDSTNLCGIPGRLGKMLSATFEEMKRVQIMQTLLKISTKNSRRAKDIENSRILDMSLEELCRARKMLN